MNAQAAQELLAGVEQIAEIFWETKGVKTKRVPSGQAAPAARSSSLFSANSQFGRTEAGAGHVARPRFVVLAALQLDPNRDRRPMGCAERASASAAASGR